MRRSTLAVRRSPDRMAERAPNFAALGISAPLVRALKMLSITTPTPIQAATIPAILEGRDVIGGAQTGSGKTLAFALPILHTLMKDMAGGYAVVLTPTRELGVQLHEQFLAVGQGSRMGLRCALVLGGMDMTRQANELAEQRPHILVATPGRLVDLLSSGAAQDWGLERCKYVVLDEADRLLSPTFAPALAYLFSVLPPARLRQTLLFTATLTPELERLTQKTPEPGKQPPLLRKIEMEYVCLLTQHIYTCYAHAAVRARAIAHARALPGAIAKRAAMLERAPRSCGTDGRVPHASPGGGQCAGTQSGACRPFYHHFCVTMQDRGVDIAHAHGVGHCECIAALVATTVATALTFAALPCAARAGACID